MREVTASAPGKVNLWLRVGAPARDGYHPLVSVFEALEVRETVTVRTARTPGIRVRTRAWRPDGAVDDRVSRELDALPPERNLAVRAARLLQRLAAAGPWAATADGLDLVVDKRIPLAGGRAGGSADAAATLLACNELWQVGLDASQLEAIGRTLGADVPACLTGGIALGTGRGDHMRVLHSGGSASARPAGQVSCGDEGGHTWVLALSAEGLSTPAVFRRLDVDGGPFGGWTDLVEPDDHVLRRLTGPASGLAGALVNDLEETALRLRPDLRATREAALDAGALDVVLAGSGPTVAALARDADHARDLAAAWRAQRVPLVADFMVARGPAQGARLEGLPADLSASDERGKACGAHTE